MEEKQPSYLEKIPTENWEKTPASVKNLVMEMALRIEKLEQQVKEVLEVQQQLLEKVNRTSKNSSSPPSVDPPGLEKKLHKPSSNKKRGGQPGHKGHNRDLYPIAQVNEIINHQPTNCSSCGEKLKGEDANPHRHQMVEIPPIEPIVIEHRLHQLSCSQCGTLTRATLPNSLLSGYGERVVATVALLSVVYRNSQRMVQSALLDLFGISMSLGTVNKLRLEVSQAVVNNVEQAKSYIQQQKVVGADETSFKQGNMDGCNPKERQAWLWVAVTPLVTFFELTLTRCSESAKSLLGENFTGILNSDRHGAYNWVNLERRQLCWAHLRRDFIKISERPGVSKELGTALVEQQEKLFRLWHQVREGTLSRCDFSELVKEIRLSIKNLLLEADQYSIGAKEKTPLAKTVRTCRQILKVESALWLFVTVEGVEPTNNTAERAIRPAVIWRRISFGSQTETGSAFVARMLTVVTTLKSQQRNVLEFLTQAVIASRQKKQAPSLLPEIPPALSPEDLFKVA